ncbi:MAG: (Na+)-NQR maturation NqrM [Gammaproteobacteria bacterium]
MLELILSFLVILIVILGMSIGISFGRKSLSGSCGGLNQIPGIEPDCAGNCQRPCSKKKLHRETGVQ